MKLVNIATPYGYRVGIQQNEGLLDLNASETIRVRRTKNMSLEASHRQASMTLPSDVMDFLALGSSAFRAAREGLTYGLKELSKSRVPWYPLDYELGPIITSPSKIFVMRGNYPMHRKEMSTRSGTTSERPDRPRYFMKPRTTLIGTGHAVIYPKVSKQVEYENELAVIVGKVGRNIPKEEVFDYIAGYTIMLDMTARDLSGKDDRQKSFDTFGPIGPCLVTGDELGDPHKCKLVLRVNGQLRQEGNTSDMQFKIPEIVSFLSEAITLEPGDLISTGTPEGVGQVQPGDEIEAEIEGIGKLRCSIIAE
jgi:2-keto-4-pentenoate hydratase/2-oxohepta-3-ene-1,7-dioic acid hydratase in catechol pathway